MATDKLALARAVGRRMSKLRIAAGLSQRALARLTRMSQAHIAELERGQRNPSLLTIATIASALDVDLLDLLRDVPKVRIRRARSQVKQLPRHVAAMARELAALTPSERTRALRAVRAVLRFAGHSRPQKCRR